MNEQPGNKPARGPEPRHPAPRPRGPDDFTAPEPGQPRTVSFQYQGNVGPAGGCVLGLLGFVFFILFAILMLIIGSVFALFGGRRIAAALFRRALKRRPDSPDTFHWNPHDPDVIDVQAEEVDENQ